jgi:hypothetical protein
MRHRLLVAVTIALTSSLASAGSSGSSATPKTASLVTERIIQPLAAKEREQSKFSRARLPAAERRVRMLDDNPQQDSAGDAFFAFAIDARHGWGDDDGEAKWTKATITGCVYPARGEVFIKRGKVFHPAAAAIGKKTKAAPERTCHAATQVSAR